MTTYEIRQNRQYDSREVYFEGKPSEAVREALKALKMRWNGKKKCWYGFAPEHELITTIQTAELTDSGEGATVYTDGYLGGGAVYGAKSGRRLSGGDLAAAIRADLKAAGIKGVTIRRGRSGGICATVTIETADLVAGYRITDSELLHRLYNHGAFDGERWIYAVEIGEPDGYGVSIAVNDPEYIALADRVSAYEVQKYSSSVDINQYYLDSDHYPELVPAFIEKLQTVAAIIGAYRYDESNSMVDYFNTNFYYDITTKPGKSWADERRVTA